MDHDKQLFQMKAQLRALWLLTGLLAALLLCGAAPGVQDKVRARSIELVDEQGRCLISLDATSRGGVFLLRDPAGESLASIIADNRSVSFGARSADGTQRAMMRAGDDGTMIALHQLPADAEVSLALQRNGASEVSAISHGRRAQASLLCQGEIATVSAYDPQSKAQANLSIADEQAGFWTAGADGERREFGVTAAASSAVAAPSAPPRPPN